MSEGKRDVVEQKLATAADAQAFCLKYHPAFLRWLDEERAWVDRQLDPPPFAEPVIDLIVMGFARMALRNGSQSPAPLHYHNESHVLEILHRLHRVMKEAPESVTDWYALALFAACHDLRQREPGQATRLRGCGVNEEASWKELERLIGDWSLDLPDHWLQAQRWMIEGSTFYMGMRLGSCQGAWAADLVRQQAMPVAVREQVLLAADLDTANVAEGFLELARSTLALAHERLLLKPAEDAQGELDFLRKFLEEVQWHYMAQCQQFRSGAGRRVFEAQKNRNLEHLRRFINRLKAHEPFADSAQLVLWYQREAEKEAAWLN